MVGHAARVHASVGPAVSVCPDNDERAAAHVAVRARRQTTVGEGQRVTRARRCGLVDVPCWLK